MPHSHQEQISSVRLHISHSELSVITKHLCVRSNQKSCH